jgi:hypothetical protein
MPDPATPHQSSLADHPVVDSAPRTTPVGTRCARPKSGAGDTVSPRRSGVWQTFASGDVQRKSDAAQHVPTVDHQIDDLPCSPIVGRRCVQCQAAPSPKSTGRQSGFRFGTTSDTGRDALRASEISGMGCGISPTFGRPRGDLLGGFGSISNVYARTFSSPLPLTNAISSRLP